MEKTDKAPYVIGGIATIFVSLLCGFTASFILYKELLANSYVRTEAIVVDHYYMRSADDDYGHYYDVVEFTVGEQTYTKVALNNGGHTYEPANIGESVTVYYNPDNPDDVLYKSPTHVLLIVVAYLVSAGSAVGATIIFYKLSKILKREREYKSRLNLWNDKDEI